MKPHAALLLGVMILLGCEGLVAGDDDENSVPPSSSPEIERPDDLPACLDATFDVFADLMPTCGGCHGADTSSPLFADIASFQTLVANDVDLVVPGRPAESQFIALLEGRATGPLPQMPLGDASFQDLEELGRTSTTVSAVRNWITNLGPCDAPPAREATLATRVSAIQIQNALEVQLGLQPADYQTRRGYSLADPLYTDPRSTSRGITRGRTSFRALGGADPLAGTQANQELSRYFVQNLGPLSQSWCRMAVEDNANSSLFGEVERRQTSADAPDAIQRNIAYLYLRMLGTSATEEEVASTYEELFLPYEAEDGPETAWMAVCAALIRDPLWLTY